jgi:hypothetical protein
MLTHQLLRNAGRGARSTTRAAAAAASSALHAAELPSNTLLPSTNNAPTTTFTRQMSFGGGAGFKGMEGFFKQEKLREMAEERLNAKARAEQYLAKKNMDGGAADGEAAGMPPPPWVGLALFLTLFILPSKHIQLKE